MRIKHSKYRNTGLIYELLVKQIAIDTLSKKDTPALEILKKYFTGDTFLVKEFRLYEFILKNKGITQNKAESIISTITEISRKLDQKTLKSQKYQIIKEIGDHYDLKGFFSEKVRDYIPLAALYCLLEAQNNLQTVDPETLVKNKVTLLEHLTSMEQNTSEVRDELLEEYSKFDKDLKALTYKILLEKFNEKYDDFLPEQKAILREFLKAATSQTRLRALVNEEIRTIRAIIESKRGSITDEVVRIKLDEVAKKAKLIEATQKVTDEDLVLIMQFYELVSELKLL